MKSFIVVILISLSLVAKAQIVVKATFAGKSEGTISKKEFLKAKKLMVAVIKADSSWATDETWNIVSYKIIVTGAQAPNKEYIVKDNVIPSEVESLVTQAEPGKTKIIFDNIASNRGNMARGLPPLELTIVE